LRTVAAIFRAAAGLDREQRREFDLVVGKMLTMSLP
jgi:hypothetical protein